MEFNPEKHYLGKLCPRGHEYEDTGKTLRRSTPGRGSGNCQQCGNFLRRTRYAFKIKEGARVYRKKNHAAVLAYQRAWNQKRQPRHHRPITEREIKAYHLNRLFLSDKYISEVFHKSFGIYITDPDMIKIKRVHLLIHRELEKIRLEKLKGGSNGQTDSSGVK